MDNLILEGVVRKLAADLPGNPVRQVARSGELEYLLRFSSPARDNLLLSLLPPSPFLHRARPGAPIRTLPPDPFAVRLGEECEGATLREVRRPSCDRVVEMTFEIPDGSMRILVAELLGKSANLLLLDEERRVISYARHMATPFRAPEVGRPYQAPIPRPGYEGVLWDPDRAGEYLGRFSATGGGRRAMAAFLRGLSPILGQDILHREEAVGDPIPPLAEILSAVARGSLQPVLYTAIPPEEILRRPAAAAEAPLLSPFPLRLPPLPVATPISDVEEASRRLAELLSRRAEERARRGRIETALRSEIRHLEKLEGKLDAELLASEKAGEHQRYGDLILAHLSDARMAGDRIRVPDFSGDRRTEIAIPADPSRSPRENADRQYARARKLRRGAVTIRHRQEMVRRRIERAREWREALAAADSLEDIRNLETSLAAARIVPEAGRGAGRPAPAPSENDPGIRTYRTADGFVILVGRTSRDNDRLTFRLAAPHDFWLHAADRSGAHVVVRNPSRLRELPKPVLLAAARMAAHFSRARGKGKVEIHYTLRKHVRKGRGCAPGMVTLRNHRTVEVEAGVPGKAEK